MNTLGVGAKLKWKKRHRRNHKTRNNIITCDMQCTQKSAKWRPDPLDFDAHSYNQFDRIVLKCVCACMICFAIWQHKSFRLNWDNSNEVRFFLTRNFCFVSFFCSVGLHYAMQLTPYILWQPPMTYLLSFARSCFFFIHDFKSFCHFFHADFSFVSFAHCEILIFFYWVR